ncbi:MAG: hypothetical protein IAE82_18240 [Opitutaceae bacterium]|nr:hypothetical protein [Opitutaceae bacterium]
MPLLAAVLCLGVPATMHAQFLDGFDAPTIDGWFTLAGDGGATIAFEPHPDTGFARMRIDSRQDAHGVWWTIIKRDVSAHLDLAKLRDPEYELRVEARVRASHAPRRVNFMINTQRTTDFHEHLREYDIADTDGWHTISMTTRNLDAGPGDQVFVQLGVTDWGSGQCHLDIDTYRADVVRRGTADVGEPLVYHPAPVAPAGFAQHLPAAHDSVVRLDYPKVNFNGWRTDLGSGPVPVLTVTANQWVVMRWDFSAWRGRTVDGAGVLELTTASLALGGDYVGAFGEDLGIEFGKIRVYEILGGDPAWDQTSVTYASLLRGEAAETVFNGQMVIDYDLTPEPGGRTLLTLPRPVMQRLVDGRTRGLVIRPLGAIAATVFASEDTQRRGPVLHFSLKP